MKSILNNEKTVNVNNIIKKIQNLKSKTRQKINLDVDLKNIEVSSKLSNEEKNKIMGGIENFNKSDEHSNFLKLNEEKKDREKSFYEDRNQLLQSFSILERALRKYSHIAFEHEEIVLDYLKQPIETLADDKNLEILQILKNLGNLLNENKLQIDDRKKEKSLEEVKKLNKEFLGQFLMKYFSFKTEIEEIENKIKITRVAEKLKSFNKKLEEANLRIEKNNEELNKLRNDVVKATNTIENLENEIENVVKEVFGEEVKIII